MESGATPLYLASQNGNIETVKHLINVGNASVKILTCDGMSCLHAAAQSGHLNIVQYLVSIDRQHWKSQHGVLYLVSIHKLKWTPHILCSTWLKREICLHRLYKSQVRSTI